MHLQSLIVLLAAVGACHAAPAEKCSQGTQSTGPCLFPEVLRECSSYAPVGVCHGYTKANGNAAVIRKSRHKRPILPREKFREAGHLG
ncbi:predicted protein [Pyrenophora tritici-repentis Pt-1C-BFP]|uniref:Uncharacterized protein n=1 Tax=Pyrenophora tritici-repentis (strain Pt-1C-BFP) TaxID=426418 RepID=B2WAF8_PYRTR|nr:uncharacterized protein PTRG_07271 [Pyrenophora tritici-repentis Pt-1C-BFP]EDU50190.1 predicted protein [Pyrenophora tritici-repentis Pt-1C-BFP]